MKVLGRELGSVMKGKATTTAITTTTTTTIIIGPHRAENIFPLGGVRETTVQLPVEPAGSKEGRVDEVRPAGGPEDVDAVPSLDPVEKRQQLVHHSVGDLDGWSR